MRASAWLLLLLAPVLALGACEQDGDSVTGSGDIVSKRYDVEGFRSIRISNAFDAEVTRADAFSAEVSADDNLIDNLVVEVLGDTLEVRLDDVRSLRDATLDVQITLPELEGVEVSGASHAELVGFGDGEAAGDLEIEASGASRVRGELVALRVSFDLSGASHVDIAGSADDAELRGSGASNLELDDFVVGSASVRLSGASRADIRVTDEISSVELSGASHLVYRGPATLGSVETSGASSIEQGPLD